MWRHNEKLTTIIKNYENHPSLLKIKSKYAMQQEFSVKPVIYQIAKRLEEKYLLTFLGNVDLLIKC